MVWLVTGTCSVCFKTLHINCHQLVLQIKHSQHERGLDVRCQWLLQCWLFELESKQHMMHNLEPEHSKSSQLSCQFCTAATHRAAAKTHFVPPDCRYETGDRILNTASNQSIMSQFVINLWSVEAFFSSKTAQLLFPFSLNMLDVLSAAASPVLWKVLAGPSCTHPPPRCPPYPGQQALLHQWWRTWGRPASPTNRHSIAHVILMWGERLKWKTFSSLLLHPLIFLCSLVCMLLMLVLLTTHWMHCSWVGPAT